MTPETLRIILVAAYSCSDKFIAPTMAAMDNKRYNLYAFNVLVV